MPSSPEESEEGREGYCLLQLHRGCATWPGLGPGALLGSAHHVHSGTLLWRLTEERDQVASFLPYLLVPALPR